MKKINLIIALALLIGVASCTDDDDDDGIGTTVQTTIEIDAADYATWTYFSFSQGKVIATDSVKNSGAFKSRNDWDIAFHRMDVKLNGGVSGDGKAEAFVAQETTDVDKFAEYKEITGDPTFVKDTESEIMVGLGQMMQGGKADYLPGTKSVVMKWIEKKPGMPPTYLIGNQLFVVKTADGKYAKVWIRAYKNAKGESAKVTMQYEYQPDGGKGFSK
jgi:hypothetical protein